jgi:DNA invertase Pin-like site-specific DNA recombinase
MQTATALPSARRSNAEELLDIVERGCARFMVCGGGLIKDGTPRLTPDQRRQLEEMFSAGLGRSEIADELGVHPATVTRHTRHLRI